MATKEETAESVRKLLSRRADLYERKMFGGIAFMIAGNMLCAVGKDHLLVRVGPEQYAEALSQPHAGPMQFTGKKSMNGYVTVDPAGYARPKDLSRWIDTALAFVETLAPKPPKADTR